MSYKRNETICSQTNDQGTLIIDTERGKVYVFGELETSIWEAVDGKTFDQVLSSLQRQYSGTGIEADLRAFLEKLVAEGLLFENANDECSESVSNT
jgi:hypothetical protein